MPAATAPSAYDRPLPSSLDDRPNPLRLRPPASLFVGWRSCPVILEECDVDWNDGPDLQRLQRAGPALGDDKGPRVDGFEEARRADVPAWESFLLREPTAAPESPNVDRPELVPRRHPLDLEQRFRVLDDTKCPTLIDSLFDKRRGLFRECIGSEFCVKRAALEEKRIDLADESSKEVRWVERAEVGDERVCRFCYVRCQVPKTPPIEKCTRPFLRVLQEDVLC